MSEAASKRTGCLALYSARIEFYANSLVQAHGFGTQPGLDHEPWMLSYQQKAVKEYIDVFPADYLRRLAEVFLGCGQTLAELPDQMDERKEDWHVVTAYLQNGSRAIGDALGIKIEPMWEDPTDKSPTTPAVVRFDVLATYVSKQGALRLAKAGRGVSTSLGEMRQITTGQVEILRQMALGTKNDDVARNLGFARRSFYRELDAIRNSLGVETNQQAIALAAHNSWI